LDFGIEKTPQKKKLKKKWILRYFWAFP